MRPADAVAPSAALVPGRRDLLATLSGGRSRHELEFLPAALEIMDTPPAPAARLIPMVICFAAAAVIGWACIGRVDIVANAPGTIIPFARTAEIQARETGAVSRILVADGAHVMAGQALIVLDPVAAVAARDRAAADLLRARLDVAGLTTLRAALASAGDKRIAFPAPAGAPRSMVAEEDAAVTARWAEERAKVADLTDQLAEKRVEAVENAATVDKLRASLPMLAAIRDVYRKLYAEQLGSRIDLLTREEAYSDAAHDLALALAHGGEADAEAAAIGRRVAAERATYANGVLTDLAASTQKLFEAMAVFVAANHEAASTVLRAPVAGTVQLLAVHAVGEVATPGERLMAVVPDRGRLIVQAVISNRDIGWVRPGERVAIKVAAFPFTRYGLVDGVVTGIDRDAMDDRPHGAASPASEDAASGSARPVAGSEADLDGGTGDGYVAEITLARKTIETESGQVRLRPGMAVTAEVITGRRRVITYVLSPVERYRIDAGRER